MRTLLVTLLALGFVLLDVVVIVAMSNMIGWSSVSSDTLFWLLLIAVAGMIVGIIGLRWLHKSSLQG